MFILTGCMSLQPDPSLLQQTNYAKPAVKSDYTLSVSINPIVGKQISAGGLTDLVNHSLKIAIDNANTFKPNAKTQYKIEAYIEQASQAAVSFGRFPGKLRINYLVKSPKGKTVFKKSIYTEAESDKWYIAAGMRHSRSRIINVAKNVNQFVKELNIKLRK